MSLDAECEENGTVLKQPLMFFTEILFTELLFIEKLLKA